MRAYMSDDSTDKYILQTLAGILPRDLWNHRAEKSSDTFEGYTFSESRIAKRKFRKLKRKAGVKKGDSAKVMWSKINWFLLRGKDS